MPSNRTTWTSLSDRAVGGAGAGTVLKAAPDAQARPFELPARAARAQRKDAQPAAPEPEPAVRIARQADHGVVLEITCPCGETFEVHCIYEDLTGPGPEAAEADLPPKETLE